METSYLERLMNPELLFGLAVRFFGVFVVLIVLMLILYLSGWILQRFAAAAGPAGAAPPPRKQAAPGPAPRPSKGSAAAPAEPSAPAVSDETAAVIALCIQASLEDGSLAAGVGPSHDEVAAAVALALSDPCLEPVLSPQRYGTPEPLAASGGGVRESPWKLLGRQEAFSRNDPWAIRRAGDREPTHREFEK